jgi:hypothetical protein
MAALPGRDALRRKPIGPSHNAVYFGVSKNLACSFTAWERRLPAGTGEEPHVSGAARMAALPGSRSKETVLGIPTDLAKVA